MLFPSDRRSYPESEVLLRELDASGVLLLTFNRPDRNNGWTMELEEAYFGSLLAAAEDPAVRVIVVTGAGRSFCPGLDMLALEENAKAGRTASLRRWPMTLARFVPKPVIAAVNGAAAGIGLVQVASADIRFAASTAKLTTAFVRRGLPAEHGVSWILPRLLGTATAMELLLSGRVILAAEALTLGLVSQVHDPEELLDRTLEYARDLASNCSPQAMATIKRQVWADLEGDAEGARLKSLTLAAEHVASPDFEEGVASFQERRPPKFPGYSARVDVHRGA